MTMGYGMGAGGACPQCGYPGMQAGPQAGMMGAGPVYGQPFMGQPFMGQPFMGQPYGGMYPMMGPGFPYVQPFMAPPFAGMYPAGGTMMGPTMGLGPGMMPRPAFGGMAWPGYTLPTFGTTGVPSDEQLREMIYDAIDSDPMVPYDSDINVEVTGGVVTLTGTVPSKRIKHAIGDDVWWIPGVWDISNSLQVVTRRARVAAEEVTPTPTTAGARAGATARAR